MLPHKLLEQRLQQAVASALPDAAAASVLVRPCPNPKFGDYQCNAIMALAKERKIDPKKLAREVADKLELPVWFQPPEIVGPGFLNFRLSEGALGEIFQAATARGHLFFETAGPENRRTIVLDFSSPNVARRMHVGHIRSTILGECLTRTLRLLGHRVVTDNHIGDWGTQFGKLLVGWKEQLDRAALRADPLAEMERLYIAINQASEADPAVLERARQELVKLQNGDAENLAVWREMIALSQTRFDAIYQRLGVKFDHTLGESFYNPRLKAVVQELGDRGVARESEGAMAVFFDDVPALREQPALIQKSDGAANYMTTDLATLAYRLETWHPDEIIYVTDARQQLHFKQLFLIFHRWHPEATCQLVHVGFGAILGEDGKPFKTRSGENIKLANLLDEAEERAFKLVSEKNLEWDEAQRREIARMVGLGAVKYADLLPNRQSDYVFSWDKMLSFNGNTAPYLQYAHTRIRSIFRRGGPDALVPNDGSSSERSPVFKLSAAEEIALAKHLLNFGLVLAAVVEEYRPNYLCNYLYDLAGRFTRFYETCPVLKAEGRQRSSRLALCDLTGQVLKQGLEVLGIETPERM